MIFTAEYSFLIIVFSLRLSFYFFRYRLRRHKSLSAVSLAFLALVTADTISLIEGFGMKAKAPAESGKNPQNSFYVFQRPTPLNAGNTLYSSITSHSEIRFVIYFFK